MKQTIVYIKKGQEYEVIKCKDLGEGHKVYQEKLNQDHDYLELGIDKIDIDGTYKIVRKNIK